MKPHHRLAILVLCVCALGCDDRDFDETEDAGAPVDPVLLAFLSRARSAHHAADVREHQQQIPKALEALNEIVSGPYPEPRRFAEVREVLADTLARTAELKSRQQRFSEAISDLDSGLRFAKEPTYFRGHLLEIRGVIEERRAQHLKKQGHLLQARAAEKKALEAFEAAMRIQARVIDHSLSSPNDD